MGQSHCTVEISLSVSVNKYSLHTVNLQIRFLIILLQSSIPTWIPSSLTSYLLLKLPPQVNLTSSEGSEWILYRCAFHEATGQLNRVFNWGSWCLDNQAPWHFRVLSISMAFKTHKEIGCDSWWLLGRRHKTINETMTTLAKWGYSLIILYLIRSSWFLSKRFGDSVTSTLSYLSGYNCWRHPPSYFHRLHHIFYST